MAGSAVPFEPLCFSEAVQILGFDCRELVPRRHQLKVAWLHDG
jgi:hypothetical protein